jgi:hypothetical protein
VFSPSMKQLNNLCNEAKNFFLLTNQKALGMSLACCATNMIISVSPTINKAFLICFLQHQLGLDIYFKEWKIELSPASKILKKV